MTQTQEHVRRELERLIQEAGHIIFGDDKEERETSGYAYQAWFSSALKIVEVLGPERLKEFIGYYQADPKRKQLSVLTYTIQDWIMGIGPKRSSSGTVPFDTWVAVNNRLRNQRQILFGLGTRINSVLSDVTGHLFAEILEAELLEAEDLIPTNVRAAGALAGVILERHLQRVAANHKLTIPKRDPTIADLNDPLKQAGVYDTPTWRKIQFLGDIRNLCSHQKSSEPTKEQVLELIAGVSSVIDTVV